MSEINDFKDLKIWQKGIDIAEKCYFLTNPLRGGNREEGTGNSDEEISPEVRFKASLLVGEKILVSQGRLKPHPLWVA